MSHDYFDHAGEQAVNVLSEMLQDDLVDAVTTGIKSHEARLTSTTRELGAAARDLGHSVSATSNQLETAMQDAASKIADINAAIERAHREFLATVSREVRKEVEKHSRGQSELLQELKQAYSGDWLKRLIELKASVETQRVRQIAIIVLLSGGVVVLLTLLFLVLHSL